MGQQSWFIGSLRTPNIFVYSCFLLGGGRRASPKPPKASPKPPKASPKHPQSLPKHPQSIPKASQSLPKAFPDYPKLSERLPRRLQSQNTIQLWYSHGATANFEDETTNEIWRPYTVRGNIAFKISLEEKLLFSSLISKNGRQGRGQSQIFFKVFPPN